MFPSLRELNEPFRDSHHGLDSPGCGRRTIPEASLFSRHLRSMANVNRARRRALGFVSRSGIKKEVQRLNEGQT
jgi:hypothetical protein